LINGAADLAAIFIRLIGARVGTRRRVRSVLVPDPAHDTAQPGYDGAA
jgi:hypothetical protein